MLRIPSYDHDLSHQVSKHFSFQKSIENISSGLILGDPLPLLERFQQDFRKKMNENISQNSNQSEQICLTEVDIFPCSKRRILSCNESEINSNNDQWNKNFIQGISENSYELTSGVSQLKSDQSSYQENTQRFQIQKQIKAKTNAKNIGKDYINFFEDHKCRKISNTLERCYICFIALKQCFIHAKTACPLANHLQISTMDYLSIFQKKIMSQKREKEGRFKRFLNPLNIIDIRYLVFYTLDRISPFLGIEDFLEQEPIKIPLCLKNYKEKVMNVSFPSVQVQGDYECSNIQSCSIDKTNSQLMVILNSDTNTKGCIHWFQFTIIAKQACSLQMTLLNNQRSGIFYEQGMQIAIQDSLDAQSLESSSWKRGGEKISYKNNVDQTYSRSVSNKNAINESSKKKENNSCCYTNNTNLNNNFQSQASNYSTLEFTYNFIQPGQRVVFSLCFSYSFTDLCRFIEKQEEILKKNQIETPELIIKKQKEKQLKQAPLQQQQKAISNLAPKKKYFESFKIITEDILYKKKVIALSRLGLPIFLIKITANKKTSPFKKLKRKVIFVVARQHPGETPSSFVCQGLISFLLSDQITAKILRSVYIFKIIPMVNPDGVVLGNSRCNLSGYDLNRKWQFPDEKLTPEVFFTKAEMKKAQQKREILIFCDLHGHSTQMGFFLYGCDKNSDGQSWTKARLLPHILAKRSEAFVLNQCKFKVTEDRASTARISAWRDLKISCSFTLETSFYGFVQEKNNEKTCIPFSIEDLLEIGVVLGQSLFENFVILDKLYAEIEENKGVLSSQPSINQKKMKDIQKKRANSCKKNNPNCLLKKRSSSPTPLGEEKIQIPKKKQLKQNSVVMEQIIKEACPQVENNWRDYFNLEDLEQNFHLISQGDDPNELESLDCGSEAEPEEDLYHESEWPFPQEGQSQVEAQKDGQVISNNSLQKEQLKQEIVLEEQGQLNQVKTKPDSKYPILQEKNNLKLPQLPYQQQQLSIQRNRYPINQVGQQFQNQNFQSHLNSERQVDPIRLLKLHEERKKKQMVRLRFKYEYQLQQQTASSIMEEKKIKSKRLLTEESSFITPLNMSPTSYLNSNQIEGSFEDLEDKNQRRINQFYRQLSHQKLEIEKLKKQQKIVSLSPKNQNQIHSRFMSEEEKNFLESNINQSFLQNEENKMKMFKKQNNISNLVMASNLSNKAASGIRGRSQNVSKYETPKNLIRDDEISFSQQTPQFLLLNKHPIYGTKGSKNKINNSFSVSNQNSSRARVISSMQATSNVDNSSKLQQINCPMNYLQFSPKEASPQQNAFQKAQHDKLKYFIQIKEKRSGEIKYSLQTEMKNKFISQNQSKLLESSVNTTNHHQNTSNHNNNSVMQNNPQFIESLDCDRILPSQTSASLAQRYQLPVPKEKISTHKMFPLPYSLNNGNQSQHSG